MGKAKARSLSSFLTFKRSQWIICFQVICLLCLLSKSKTCEIGGPNEGPGVWVVSWEIVHLLCPERMVFGLKLLVLER